MQNMESSLGNCHKEYFLLATDKSGYPHNIFLISPHKHLLWVCLC